MRELLLILLLTALGINSAPAHPDEGRDWQQTNGPYGGDVPALAVSPAIGGAGGTNLFAGTPDR